MNRTTSNLRLIRLAEFLDELPPTRFDYSLLIGDDWGGAEDLSCGTTACALGWAAAMPEFRRLGLVIRRNPMDPTLADVGLMQEPNLDEYRAGAVIFGISYAEAWFLFEPRSHGDDVGCDWQAPGDNATAKDVADHIRRFVKGRMAEQQISLERVAEMAVSDRV